MEFVDINNSDKIIQIYKDYYGNNLSDIKTFYDGLNFTKEMYVTMNGPIGYTLYKDKYIFYIPNGSQGDLIKLKEIMENTNNNPQKICRTLEYRDILSDKILSRSHFVFNDVYYEIKKS